MEVEQPFGTDFNDLPLDRITSAVVRVRAVGTGGAHTHTREPATAAMLRLAKRATRCFYLKASLPPSLNNNAKLRTQYVALNERVRDPPCFCVGGRLLFSPPLPRSLLKQTLALPLSHHKK